MSTQDRAPSFPFYPKDWLADPKVRAMTFDQKGRYIDLLSCMWDFGDAGCYIPVSIAQRIVGKAFVKFVGESGLLVLEDNEAGDGAPCLFSDRLMELAQKCGSRSAAAKRSAELRWEHERATKGECKGNANA